MLKQVFGTLACTLMALAIAPAGAQQPSRTTDDYVCTFAGQCDNQAQADQDAARTPGAPRVSSTRGFSLARPNGAPATPAPASAGTARKAGNRTSSSSSPNRVATVVRPEPAHGQRADLRLSFDLGSATLTSVARAEAKVFADSLMRPELKNMKFVIEGHTDSIGSRDYNIDLSRRRAQAVADFLVSQGVSRDRLDIRGYGFDRPLPGLSAAAEANRRVEAVRTS